MRQIIGKKIYDVKAEELMNLASQYETCIYDLGAGDGKNSLRLAQLNSRSLVIAIDAVKENLAKISDPRRKTAAGLMVKNLIFIWSSIEKLPQDLPKANTMIANMPWGSLQAGLLGKNDLILTRLRQKFHTAANFIFTFNLHAWFPPVAAVADLPIPTIEWVKTELANKYELFDMRINQVELKTLADKTQLLTSWSKRLYASKSRFNVLEIQGKIINTKKIN